MWILIKKPSDQEFVSCQIVSVSISEKLNTANIYVKGVSAYQNIKTLIIINDLKDFIAGNEIKSLHGYFKLKIHESSKNLFTTAE